MSTTDTPRCLPEDVRTAKLVGRVWTVGRIPGPSIVIVDRNELVDVTAYVPTMADIINHPNPARLWAELPRNLSLGPVEELARQGFLNRCDPRFSHLLAPCDIQGIKACGVTFARSLIERVIEEAARGDAAGGAQLRAKLEQSLGGLLEGLRPGSAEAQQLKRELSAQGLWSQYLEVGIGPDAEVFTKAQPMAAVGFGHSVGVHPHSDWNNPEPEVVLAVSASGRIVGVSLGNDVNLRDFEGRSALLLGRAKDNNASCAIGPFIRLLDEEFGLAEVRALKVTMKVLGADGFAHAGHSSLSEISRDIEELVEQAMGEHHQYPDGMMLFTGTLYTPTENRGNSKNGFTHQRGDIVVIESPAVGALANVVEYTNRIAPWTFGIGALLRNLRERGYLAAPTGR